MDVMKRNFEVLSNTSAISIVAKFRSNK